MPKSAESRKLALPPGVSTPPENPLTTYSG
jgi:hypothetical protein